MSIRKRDVHFSDWTKVRNALVCNNVQGITELSSFEDVRAFLINSESSLNPFYYYVCYIKETKEIYTHGSFYNCDGYDDSEIRNIIQNIEDVFSEQITTLQNEIEENEKVTTMALYDLNDRKADKDDLQNINLDKYVDWDSWYNETNSLYSSLQSTINSNYTTLNNKIGTKANASDLNTLSAEVEENEEVTAAALTNLHETKVDKSELPDFSEFATKTDLNTKQDLLVSGTNIKTVNNLDITGSGNIETPDTKVTSVENHYKTDGVSAQSTIGFATDVIYDAAGHITGITARSITESDIPEIDASKISKGTISIDRLPHGALERLYVLTNRTAAMENTEISSGDTIMLTEEDSLMFFCVNDSATTFEEKFKGYTAGAATAVNWSGIIDKPEGIDNWGNRISAIEGTYATQSWVGSNYLSKSGGIITADDIASFTIYRNNGVNSVIHFYNTQDGDMKDVGYLGVASNGRPVYLDSGGTIFDLIHSGNYSGYALPNSGGTISGTEEAVLKINTSYAVGVAVNFRVGDKSRAWVGYNTSDGAYLADADWGYTIRIGTDGKPYYRSYELIHANNIGSYNAGSATKLATPRTIWGQSFDGTGDVNGQITNHDSLVIDAADYYNSYWSRGFVFLANGVESGGVYGFGAGKNLSDIIITASGGRSNGQGIMLFKNGNVSIGIADAEAKLHVHGDARIDGVIKGVSVVRNANSNWLVGEDDIDGNIYIGSNAFAKARILDNNNGQLALTAVGGVLAKLPLLLTDPSLGALDSAGVFQLTNDYGFGMYSWVRNTGDGYIQVGSDSRYSGAYAYNLYLNPLGGNVAIGGTTADAKLHVHGNIITTGDIEGGIFGLRNSSPDNPLLRLTVGNQNYYVQATSDGIYLGPTSTLSLKVDANGNTTINGVLVVSGGISSSANIYAPDFCTTSDSRLKDFTKDVEIDFENLKNIPKKYYYWKDKSMGENLQIGTSAQELMKVYPTCVYYNEEEDKYSVNYQKLSIVALAAIDKLHDRVKYLESKIND